MAKISLGAIVAPFAVADMYGHEVHIPDTTFRLTHLQFRRFAGCPICNLHLRQVVERKEEIAAAGVREIIFFHSSAEALKEHESHLPLPVIPDPEKKWYRQFGVEKSLTGLFNPKSILSALSGLSLRNLAPALSLNEEHTGLPADFLIDTSGRVVAVQYGAHASDQWSVDELLKFAKEIN